MEIVGAPKVFISYRRSDVAGEARLLYEGLAQRFGTGNVFLDVETINAGSDWLRTIRAGTAEAGAFLALIGPGWLRSLRERAPMGQTDEPDVVVREIELALAKRSALAVIPVLVGGAVMPEAGQLPRSIRPLVSLHAVTLTHERWNADLQKLVAELTAPPPGAEEPHADEAISPAAAPPMASPRTRITAVPARRPPEPAHFDRVLLRIFEGTLVPILGPGVNTTDRSAGLTGSTHALPDAHELAAALAERFQIAPDARDLSSVAQSVYVKDGRSNLYRTLSQILTLPEYEPGGVHRFLASLPGMLREQGNPVCHQMIVTANYDHALESAFDELREPYDLAIYMASGPDQGRFLHVPWAGDPTPVKVANAYRDFPFLYDGERGEEELERTLIVKIYGTGDSAPDSAGWSENYVVTEDNFIDYLSGVPASSLVPVQILRKLVNSHCLFLGYEMRDWSLRVFLKRVWEGRPFETLSFAVERDPDALEEDFWRQYGVELVTASPEDYVSGLSSHLSTQSELAP